MVIIISSYRYNLVNSYFNVVMVTLTVVFMVANIAVAMVT